MTKEIEREGIPAVIITAIPAIPESIGCSRIIRGIAITNPVGDPNLPTDLEKQGRKKLIEKALKALETKVEGRSIVS